MTIRLSSSDSANHMDDTKISEGANSLQLPHTRPFISYAQNAEDVMLWRALASVDRGRYIDVGAAEPDVDSVTQAFYERGWRGINIEPAPRAFARLAAARPEDLNLNIALGERNGITPFYLVDGGNGLSTTQFEQSDTLKAQGWKSTKIEVPVLTLASVMESHALGPIHFLKIDVEGAERAGHCQVDW
jgi:FkbM family methyltransferase